MKPQLLFLMWLLFLLSCACRTSKERSSTTSRLEALAHGQYAVQWQQADSNLRYWYYQSDSAFYYHPDSGLYASSGWLTIEEQRFKNTFAQVHQDSSYYLHSQQSAEQEKSVIKDHSKLRLYMIGAGVFLVLGAGFYVGKRILF